MKLINVDLGECLQQDPDPEVMPFIDMANIACGGHAGDHASIVKTLLLAKGHKVVVGAHPSYDDKANFGRISHSLTTQQLTELLQQQLTVFKDCCQQQQLTMSYIKPHGALYHDMMHKPEVLDAICQFIIEFDNSVSLVVQAGINQTQMQQVSAQTGITFIYEAFADRAYQAEQLIPRTQANAMLQKPEHIVGQYHSLSKKTSFQVDTVCFHSDHPASIDALKMIKRHVYD